jgi:hypothetical protein
MTAPGFRFDLVCRLDRNELDLAFSPYVARAIYFSVCPKTI